VRRLSEQQIVEIHPESDDPVMTCRIASVTGSVATLTCDQDCWWIAKALAPAAAGHLVFVHKGSLVALRGIAAIPSTDEPTLEFVVIDNVVLPERRAAERIPLAARARLGRVAGADVIVETATADISLSGALVVRVPGIEVGQQRTLELVLNSDPRPINCTAEVVRETPTHLGLRFVEMTEEDRTRLAGIIFRYQRNRQSEKAPAMAGTAQR
jgi:hypothetical protein